MPRQKKAYYAFPVKMQAFHITYWADMIEKAGFRESDIPKSWAEYWSFWCDKVQPAYRKASGQRIYAMGIPLSITSSDTYQMFLPFADAYDVRMVDEHGKLLVDDPAVRAGLIKALTDYTTPYLKGCVPPSATSWKDPDNNVAQNNKTTVMTLQRHDLHRREVARRRQQREPVRRRPRDGQEELLRAHPHHGISQPAGRNADW